MRIIKFSSPSCQPCSLVDSFLKEKNIEFTNYDVSDPKNLELANSYSIRRVPVTILLSDKEISLKKVLGFNTQELDELLKDFTNGTI